MKLTIASISPKIRGLVKLHNAVLLATAFAALSRSGQTPDIFHHWPHAAPTTIGTDDEAGPDIFHHWPHLALLESNGARNPNPDIFHHWPHAA